MEKTELLEDTEVVGGDNDGIQDGESIGDWEHLYAFRTIVNALAHQLNWESDLRGWIADASWAIDVAAIDWYPGTKDFGSCTSWSPLDTLFQVMVDTGKDGAIMETGYSWFVGNGEGDQQNWVNCALPIIRDKAKTHNAAHPTVPFLVASWFELVDANTGGLWVEDHYGLIRSGDFTEKQAYDDFRTLVPTFNF